MAVDSETVNDETNELGALSARSRHSRQSSQSTSLLGCSGDGTEESMAKGGALKSDNRARLMHESSQADVTLMRSQTSDRLVEATIDMADERLRQKEVTLGQLRQLCSKLNETVETLSQELHEETSIVSEMRDGFFKAQAQMASDLKEMKVQNERLVKEVCNCQCAVFQIS